MNPISVSLILISTKTYIMETLIYYFEKIYNTIKANGIYIFLSVFFVFLLFVISDVSDDFIYALSDKENVSNVFFIALAFTLLALSLWVVPAAFLKLFLGPDMTLSSLLFFYESFEEIYNGKKNKKRNQISVKYIAIAPWVIYVITLTICLMKSLYMIKSEWYIGVFIWMLIFSFYILNLVSSIYHVFYRFFAKNKTRKRLLNNLVYIFIVIAVLPLIIYLLSFFKYPEITEECFDIESCIKSYYRTFLMLLISYNIFCILGIFLFLIYKEKERTTIENKYKFSKDLHLSTIIISISLLLIFCLFSLNLKLIWISPTVVLVIVSTVFILAFEFLYTTPRIIIAIDRYKADVATGKYKKQKFIFYGVLLIAAFFTFIMPFKTIYLVKSETGSGLCKPKTNKDQRWMLNGYFYQWLVHNHHFNEKDYTEPIDVILISGEGGGSTAGSWLLANLLNAERTYPQFYNNIFSLSTVSGSSNGANFYLATKTGKILQEDPNSQFIDVRKKKFITELYARNYFSSNFLGLMFSDYFVNPIASLVKEENIDRNYILQQEEKEAMQAAGLAVNSNNLKSIKGYFDQNYLDLWYKDIKEKDQLNPLFFINTTSMETGQKAVFSPVQTGDLGLRTQDILIKFTENKKGRGFYIPMSAAVAQSQAFPLLSTYNKVPGLGHLGDGGFYENTGTATTLAIYRRLKAYYEEYLVEKLHTKRPIRFILINFVSHKDIDEDYCAGIIKPKTKSDKDDSSFGFLKKSMLYHTIAQTYKTPFQGHSKDALKALKMEVDNNNLRYNKDKRSRIDDLFFNIENSEKFATTRLISKKTINEMFRFGANGKGMSMITDSLKKAVKKRNLKISIENKGSNVFNVYIRYTNKAVKAEKDLIRDLRNYISNEPIAFNSQKLQLKYVFSVSGTEKIDSFDINQIRYFHTEDKTAAEKLCIKLNERGFNLKPVYFDYNNFSSAIPFGQLDIWIDDIKKPIIYNDNVKR